MQRQFRLMAMSFNVCLASWWFWMKGDWLLCPPAAWGHCCSWAQEHLLCPLPWTCVLAREIVSNVGWAALSHTLFCIKHFPPWKLPWLTANFKIIINVFAQGFWNLISLFWTVLKSVCLEKQKIPPWHLLSPFIGFHWKGKILAGFAGLHPPVATDAAAEDKPQALQREQLVLGCIKAPPGHEWVYVGTGWAAEHGRTQPAGDKGLCSVPAHSLFLLLTQACLHPDSRAAWTGLPFPSSLVSSGKFHSLTEIWMGVTSRGQLAQRDFHLTFWKHRVQDSGSATPHPERVAGCACSRVRICRLSVFIRRLV